ncbi:MAG: amidohydrolase family protein [Candidatus Latescibacterota bacterium]
MDPELVIDVSAWTGHWGTLPVRGSAAQVRASLRRVGVDLICLSPLEGLWCHNPHLGNAAVYAAARRWSDVLPVPVLDPTIPTWPAQVARARAAGAPMVRLVPAYSGIGMERTDPVLAALAEMGMPVVVQVRVEDPRRQHPLAQVPDTPAADVVAAARRHPGLTVVLGGAAWRTLLDLRDEILGLPAFYADTSQVDGLDSLRLMVEAGLTERLVFGSHAPLFVPLAGLARVLTDLQDIAARAILSGNAQRLLGPSAVSRPVRPPAEGAGQGR